MNRDDFLMLKQNIIYFDNAATSLKPYILSESISDYYNKYCANSHRGDYDISLLVDTLFKKTKQNVQKFINAKSNKEIIFTYSTTDALNKIIFGYFKNILKKDDEILITKTEHASLVLPIFELSDQITAKIKYIELDENNEISIENVKNAITKKTKLIAVSHITNVIGDIRPIKEICKYAHQLGIKVLVDGAQSTPHMKIDVQDLNVDFYCFSAHKMLGPTGLGILYGKQEYLNNCHPIIFGGGMNVTFGNNKIRIYKEIPELLEAGTLPLAQILSFGKIIEYIENIGIENIDKYVTKLKKYAVDKLQTVKNIEIYNKFQNTGILTFNIKGIKPSDLGSYLNNYKICVRSGSHCAKMFNEMIDIPSTVRISLYFYNTEEEIDYLVKVLNNPNIMNELI